MKTFYAHETAIVDDGAIIGSGTKVWHFAHVFKGAVIGENCSFGQNTMVSGGVTVGSNVDDMRESPSFHLMDRLHERGAQVEYHDPYIPVIAPTREHASWTGRESLAWAEDSIRSCDAVLIATNHACVDYQQLTEWCDCIIDSRNATRGIQVEVDQVTRS